MITIDFQRITENHRIDFVDLRLFPAADYPTEMPYGDPKDDESEQRTGC